jgi:hypothetical protein
MPAVTVGMKAGDRLLVELGEEDVGYGLMDRFGRGLEEIGETDVEAAIAKPDGGIEGGKPAEANVECGDGSAGSEIAVLMFEDGDEGGGCGDLFCSGLFGFGGWRG